MQLWRARRWRVSIWHAPCLRPNAAAGTGRHTRLGYLQHDALSLYITDESYGRCICHSCHDRLSSFKLGQAPKACPQDALGLVLCWKAQLAMLCQVCHQRICRYAASVISTHIPLLKHQEGCSRHRARRAAHSRPGRRRKLTPTLPLLGSTLSAVWACR